MELKTIIISLLVISSFKPIIPIPFDTQSCDKIVYKQNLTSVFPISSIEEEEPTETVGVGLNGESSQTDTENLECNPKNCTLTASSNKTRINSVSRNGKTICENIKDGNDRKLSVYLVYEETSYNFDGNCKIKEKDLKYASGRNLPISLPWHVQIIDDYGQHVCGGTVINGQNIITAAHCIEENEKYKIILANNQVLNIIDNIIHDKFRAGKLPFDIDIALLLTEYEIQFSDKVHPINIRSSDSYNLLTSKTVYIPVFIKVRYTTKQQSKFDTTTTEADVIDDLSCLKTNYNLAKLTTDNNFCVQINHGEIPSQGDSGNGLVIYNGSYFELIGIVSFSPNPIDSETAPLVCTKVSKNIEWIRSNS